MPSKQWWTVSAVYDDNEQSYVAHFEACSWQEAWKQALHAADGIIRKSAIFAGKCNAVDLDEAASIVPIRGQPHALDVAQVHVTPQRILIPGRCPQCKQGLRRAGALLETFLVANQWRAHLATNNQTLSHERDGVAVATGTTIATARLVCAACQHAIWDGLHVD